MFLMCQPLKQKGKQFGQQNRVYLGIAEELQFRICKLWQTIGKSGEQRRGKGAVGRGCSEGKFIGGEQSLGLWQFLIGWIVAGQGENLPSFCWGV